MGAARREEEGVRPSRDPRLPSSLASFSETVRSCSPVKQHVLGCCEVWPVGGSRASCWKPSRVAGAVRGERFAAVGDPVDSDEVKCRETLVAAAVLASGRLVVPAMALARSPSPPALSGRESVAVPTTTRAASVPNPARRCQLHDFATAPVTSHSAKYTTCSQG